MKQEIRDRIEKIKNGEMPEGFKKSENVVIPSEWSIDKLNKIINECRLGGNYSNNNERNGLPLIKMGNIGRGNIILNNMYYITDEEINEEDKLEEGDLLFNTRNTLDLVGKVAIWRDELPLAYYNSNLLRISFHDEVISTNYFMNYQFNSYRIIKSLRRLATGTTSVAAIYTRDLLNCKFVIPPLQEQQEIASILSTWDKAIELKEKLIDEKKKQKKGLMQKLLTGEVRLPGFDGEWKEVRLGEVCNVINGDRGKNYPSTNDFLSIGVPFINAGHMRNNRINFLNMDYINVDKYNSMGSGKIIKNDILFCLRGSLGKYAIVDFEIGVIASSLAILRSKPDFLMFEYLNQLLGSDIIRFQIERDNNGSSQPNLSASSVSNFTIKLPLIKEQHFISKILFRADEEIALLEQELEALKLQKKGLMQLLLTGIVRVNTEN